MNIHVHMQRPYICIGLLFTHVPDMYALVHMHTDVYVGTKSAYTCGSVVVHTIIVLSPELSSLPLCSSAWGSSRCCSSIPHSLQKIKQTNEKLTPLLARDTPELPKLPPAA